MVVARDVRAAADATRQTDKAVEALTDEEVKFADALDKVRTQFADLANTDPAEFARQEADVNSDYNAALAKATHTTPAAAVATAMKVRVKIRRMVEVLERKGVLRFSYHCPFCGGTDSMGCAYYSVSEAVNPQSFEYSKQWLIEHSLQKPWVETIIEKHQVERVVDEVQEVGGGTGGAGYLGSELLFHR